MEYAVHVSPFVETVEYGSCDIAHPFGDNPTDGQHAHVVDEWLERHEHAQAHGDKTNSLKVAVLLEVNQTGNGTSDGACPDEDEKSPSPKPVAAQGNECDG